MVPLNLNAGCKRLQNQMLMSSCVSLRILLCNVVHNFKRFQALSQDYYFLFEWDFLVTPGSNVVSDNLLETKELAALVSQFSYSDWLYRCIAVLINGSAPY